MEKRSHFSQMTFLCSHYPAILSLWNSIPTLKCSSMFGFSLVNFLFWKTLYFFWYLTLFIYFFSHRECMGFRSIFRYMAIAFVCNMLQPRNLVHYIGVLNQSERDVIDWQLKPRLLCLPIGWPLHSHIFGLQHATA